MEYFLAIDSGGTKCESVLVGRDGKVIGFSRYEEKNLSGRSEKAILESARGTMRQFVPENVYLVGFACKYRASVMHGLGFNLFPNGDEGVGRRSIRIMLTTEGQSEFSLYGLQDGVIMLSGTGSFVLGRNKEGRQRHYDGMGPILGDFGSGYSIGIKAAKHVIKVGWHPRHSTSLRERVFQHFGIASEGQLVTLSLSNPDRTVFASLATIVNEEAEKGDAVAVKILKESAGEICQTFHDVVTSLEMEKDKYTLVGVGGVITNSRIYWDEVVSYVSKTAPNFECVLEKRPPVLGVAVNGMREILRLDDAKTAALSRKITESYYEFIRKEQDEARQVPVS